MAAVRASGRGPGPRHRRRGSRDPGAHVVPLPVGADLPGVVSMSQENKAQQSNTPEDRRREDAQRQGQRPGSPSSPSQKSIGAKSGSECTPCEEKNRSLSGAEG